MPYQNVIPGQNNTRRKIWLGVGALVFLLLAFFLGRMLWPQGGNAPTGNSGAATSSYSGFVVQAVVTKVMGTKVYVQAPKTGANGQPTYGDKIADLTPHAAIVRVTAQNGQRIYTPISLSVLKVMSRVTLYSSVDPSLADEFPVYRLEFLY